VTQIDEVCLKGRKKEAMAKRKTKRSKYLRAAARAHGALRDIAASKWTRAKQHQHNTRNLGTFGAASPVRIIGPRSRMVSRSRQRPPRLSASRPNLLKRSEAQCNRGNAPAGCGPRSPKQRDSVFTCRANQLNKCSPSPCAAKIDLRRFSSHSAASEQTLSRSV
jgi:hypothetical protein